VRRLALLTVATALAGSTGCLGTMQAIGPFANQLEAATGVPASNAPIATEGGMIFGSRASSHALEPEGDARPGKPARPLRAEDVTEDNVYDQVKAFERELAEARKKDGPRD
jgi:hypothetical protein